MNTNDFVVKPGSRVDLGDFDPDSTKGLNKAEGEAVLLVNRKRLDDLQYLLFADASRAVLVILQAMDTGGKDGTIRDVFEGVNPISIKVTSFKAPSTLERSHDFLWRHHHAAPAKGEIGVHNRSHYESVLIERVRKFIDEKECVRRYERINEFEKLLTDSGTLVLKFYLHISKDEQRKRLQARLDDPKKNWKFNEQDVEERKLWTTYMEAYGAMLGATSTKHAPWHIVPANEKWYRNAVVSEVIADAMKDMNLKLPKLAVDVKKIKLV